MHLSHIQQLRLYRINPLGTFYIEDIPIIETTPSEKSLLRADKEYESLSEKTISGNSFNRAVTVHRVCFNNRLNALVDECSKSSQRVCINNRESTLLERFPCSSQKVCIIINKTLIIKMIFDFNFDLYKIVKQHGCR